MKSWQSFVSNSRIGFFLFMVTLFSSCDPNRVYEENIDIPMMVWEKNNKLKFEVDITDTLSIYNLFINVRNAGTYPYSNIYLFVDITFPDGKVYRDTVEGQLADANGQWLGSGLGDIWDNQIPYKQNTRFPLSGKYVFQIEQAMRDEQLHSILDAGLRVEKKK